MRLSVGDLRGLPQWTPPPGAVPASAPPLKGGSVGSLKGPGSAVESPGGVHSAPQLPPSKRGRGCCRRGCRGCPWTESMLARNQARP